MKTFKSGKPIATKYSEYKSWRNMMDACYNNKHKQYQRNKERNITVCPSWHSFDAFLRDMGKRPSMSYYLKRKEKRKSYTPSNCYWAQYNYGGSDNDVAPVVFDFF